jgi:hypothetical protein
LSSRKRGTGIQRPKIDTPGFLLEFIPVNTGAGMTNQKDANLNRRSLKMCQKFQKNGPFYPRMRLIATAMIFYNRLNFCLAFFAPLV